MPPSSRPRSAPASASSSRSSSRHRAPGFGMTSSGPASAGLERVIDLHDGRQLAVAESGDPHGVPVLFFHGTPGSRRTGPTDADLPQSLGVRLICVDRPGYGGSTRHPGRVVHDWSLDVEDLVDRLDCPTFGLAAWSGGAAF